MIYRRGGREEEREGGREGGRGREKIELILMGIGEHKKQCGEREGAGRGRKSISVIITVATQVYLSLGLNRSTGESSVSRGDVRQGHRSPKTIQQTEKYCGV